MSSRAKISCMIVDDEHLGRANLRYALAEYPQWEVLAECADAQAARASWQRQPVDVIFIDIQMPAESGLAFARMLTGELATNGKAAPLIIFVTAFQAHALEAFDVHAFDYVLKPIDDVRLQASLRRAEAMLAQRQQANYAKALPGYLENQKSPDEDTPPYWTRISVPSAGRIDMLDLAEVLWLETAGNYVTLHLAGRSLMLRITISKLAAHLDPQSFVRIHRRLIVARRQIACLSAARDKSLLLHLKCGTQLPVSSSYLTEVKNLLQSA